MKTDLQLAKEYIAILLGLLEIAPQDKGVWLENNDCELCDPNFWGVYKQMVEDTKKCATLFISQLDR
jgi:hypothetical protein